MKHTILTLALLSTLCCDIQAQSPVRDAETGKYTYKAVTEVSNVSDSTLFARGSRWFESEFKTMQLNLRNSSDGMISHTGTFPVSFKVSGTTMEFQVTFIAMVEARSNRYRYTFTDFFLSQSAAGTTEGMTLEGYIDRKVPIGKKTVARVNDEVLVQVDDEIKKKIEILARVMTGGAFNTDDW